MRGGGGRVGGGGLFLLGLEGLDELAQVFGVGVLDRTPLLPEVFVPLAELDALVYVVRDVFEFVLFFV